MYSAKRRFRLFRSPAFANQVSLTIAGTLGVDYTVTTTATRKFYRFINASATPGSVTVTTATPATIEYVAIGGGGGGGMNQGGGGGAGGLQQSTSFSLPAGTHAVTIGRGGTSRNDSDPIANTNGTATRLGTVVTALGGGYGGGSNTSQFTAGAESTTPLSGPVGCGGGGKGATNSPGGVGSQGGNGGTGTPLLSTYSGGGGGGVGPGGQGADATIVKGGDGGAGISYTIGGTTLLLGGGGGGGGQNGAGFGLGTFGGGNGNRDGGGANGLPGQANTGGGGGGGAGGSQGGTGGTGILIISHAI